MEYRNQKETEFPQNNSNPYHVYYENYLDTNACTECTGLIPYEAHSGEEWDAYRDISDFTPVPSSSKETPGSKSLTSGCSSSGNFYTGGFS